MQYSIINCSQHTVYYILMSYWFYNWKFVLFHPLHGLCPPPTPCLRPSPTCSLYLWAWLLFSAFFDSTDKWDHICLSLSYFTQHNALKIHSCCCKCQDCIFIYDWIISHCMYIPHLFIHSSISGHVGCFYTLTIANNAAVNMVVHISSWLSVCFFIKLLKKT